jgi:hypothetical protein
MFRNPLNYTIVLLLSCVALASCGRITSVGGTPPPDTAPVVLTMTNTPSTTVTPPMTVSILSAEVTLTGATLTPGNVPLFSGATTIELTRLQTDIAYIGTTLVPPGSYTGLTLTFSNPMLTFENDTSSSIVAGVGSPTPTCAKTAICTIQSVATNLSTTITLSPTMTVSATSGAGLLADVNLKNLLSATLGSDFKTGVTVSQFTPAGSDAPPVGAEDVVGHVASVDATHSKFSLQNAMTTVSLTVDNTTTFLNFPTGTCTTSSISCVQANQILSVDISIRADGTPVARNVLFEDPDSTDFEVEGIVTSAGSQQFTMVTLTESAMITGLTTGDVATIHYSTSSPATTFDKDLVFENSLPVGTTGLAFSVPADLIVGQEVQVQRNPTMSSGTSITADRVRLRSSRVSGIVLTGVSTLFDLSSLPSLFTIHAAPQIQQIQVETDSSSTICTVNGTVMGCSLLGFNPQHSFSVRGPLFANATTIVASKVIQH